MPLRQGSSREIISSNIAELIRAGHSRAQAAAIAYKEAGEDCELSEDEVLKLALGAAMDRLTVTFDRSMRRVDENGHLHVKISHISKATVNPYYGREIPRCAELGLDPQRVYQMLRDPDELRKAAPTANNLPLLDAHIITLATEPAVDHVVGSTGTDATFNDPYLDNSLVIWTQWAIDDVESEDVCELSCAYQYDAVMGEGSYKGLRYDGIMRNIRFNHVALVPEGRAGPDVVVADSKSETAPMALTSRKALMARGAVGAMVRPMLVADAKLDLDAVFDGMNAGNFKSYKGRVLARLRKATEGKLAADAKLDAISAALDAMEDDETVGDDDIEEKDDEKEEKAEAGKDKRRGKDKAMDEAEEDDEEKKEAKDRAKDKAKDRAKDEEPKAEGMDKKAMDAAIAKAAKDARAGALSDVRRYQEALSLVKPHIGEDITCDSAEDVLKLALDSAGISTDGSESYSALKTMVGMLSPPSKTPAPTVAMDAAANDRFATMFPDAARIRHA